MTDEKNTIHSFDLAEVKAAWCQLLKCSEHDLDGLVKEDGRLHFDPRVPVLADVFAPCEEHVFKGDPCMLRLLPVASYPAYIYSPLRVLNKWKSEFFPVRSRNWNISSP